MDFYGWGSFGSREPGLPCFSVLNGDYGVPELINNENNSKLSFDIIKHIYKLLLV